MCSKCQTLKFKTKEEKTQYYLEKNMLPVWYDELGEIRYDLPPELQGLSHGEKMILQRIAVLCPIVHIYQGSVGIKGHTCCFRKESVCAVNILPRTKADLICVVKETRGLRGVDDVEKSYLHVRKQKVLAALHWLKLYHRGYKDVVIQDDILSDIDDNLQCTIIRETCDPDSDQDNGTTDQCTVSHEQTEKEGIAFHETGEYRQCAGYKFSRDAYDIIKEIKRCMKENKMEIPEMEYPQIGEEPVDEYNYPHMFADAYPWLFPGGIGDGPKGETAGTLSRWTQMMIHFEDGRFMRDPFFQFHLLNFSQRMNNNQSSLFFLREYMSERETTLEDVKNAIKNGDMSFIKRLQTFTGQKIKGSDAYWRDKKKELDTWIMHHLEVGHGPPTLFLTFSCAELWWPDLKRLLCNVVKGTEDEYLAQKMMEGKHDSSAARKLVEMYSVVVQEFFQLRLEHWMSTVGKETFGIKHYYIRYEYAKGRGQIHAHVLAITQDNGISVQFYKHYVQNGDKKGGIEILSEYARNQLGLTADMPHVTSNKSDMSKGLERRFSEISNVNEDLFSLCMDCHIHECNGFCLRTPRHR